MVLDEQKKRDGDRELKRDETWTMMDERQQKTASMTRQR